MRFSAIVLALIASALPLLLLSTASAQPRVTDIFPEDGTVLTEPPTVLRLCFESPVNIRDLHEGGDFSFAVVTPDGVNLGLRVIFQTDGLGVDVQPGLPEDAPKGDWLFQWRVTDPETLEPATGSVSFAVSPDGSPLPDQPPVSCATGTPVSRGTATTPTSDAGDGDDDGPNILAISLITTASVAGAAALALILYVVRRRISYSPHEPPPGDGEEEH